MLQKIFSHKVRIALAMLFIILLALIRAYEDSLFYDPLLKHFKSDYYNLPLPEIDNLKLFIGLFFRYFLNTLFSLAIIQVLFKDIQAVKFASILYLVFFVILVMAFFITLSFFGEEKPF